MKRNRVVLLILACMAFAISGCSKDAMIKYIDINGSPVAVSDGPDSQTSCPTCPANDGKTGNITCDVYDLTAYFTNMGCQLDYDAYYREHSAQDDFSFFDALQQCGMELPNRFQAIDQKIADVSLLGPISDGDINTWFENPTWPGLTPIAQIKLNQFDVYDRSWTKGFPGFDGQKEWYGLICRGSIKVTAAELLPEQTGDNMSFLLRSDDGSRFIVKAPQAWSEKYGNGYFEIDNDGNHSFTNHDKKGALWMDKDVEYPFVMEWYQGPRFRIALELFWWSSDSSETDKHIVMADSFPSCSE